MKYINNKGYLTVEIILASSIAFVIAFFLFDVTMKLVDTTDNAFVDTVVTTDKALIVDNIKEQVQNDIKEYGVIKEATCSSNTCIVTYNDDTTRYIGIKDKGNDKTINYCSDSGLSSCTYDKKLNSSLSGYQLSIEKKENYYIFKISAQNIFAKDSDYFINILIYNNAQDLPPIVIPDPPSPTKVYTITIKRQLGDNEGKEIDSIKSTDSSLRMLSVSGTSQYPKYEKIECEGIETPQVWIHTSLVGTSPDSVDFTIIPGDITANGYCTVYFTEKTSSGGSTVCCPNGPNKPCIC